MEFELTFNTSYLVAFTMGLFSSLHCIGMCGSIIGTLTLSLKPEIRNNKKSLFSYVLNYNSGRIFSYSLAGLLVGLAGLLVGLAEALITLPFGLDHGHRLLQLLSAMIMIGAGLYIAGWFPHFAYIEKIGSKLWKQLEPYGRKLIPVKTRTHAFLFGMIWGWLPCGLVYAALALASTTGDIMRSSLTMLAFGLGTLPSVMGLGITTDILTKLSKTHQFKQVIGVLLVIVALVSVFPELNPMRLQHF